MEKSESIGVLGQKENTSRVKKQSTSVSMKRSKTKSAKNGSRKTEKYQHLSDEQANNVLHSAFDIIREKYGEVFIVSPAGGRPQVLLPDTMRCCIKCRRVMRKWDNELYCKDHADNKEVEF